MMRPLFEKADEVNYIIELTYSFVKNKRSLMPFKDQNKKIITYNIQAIAKAPTTMNTGNTLLE